MRTRFKMRRSLAPLVLAFAPAVVLAVDPTLAPRGSKPATPPPSATAEPAAPVANPAAGSGRAAETSGRTAVPDTAALNQANRLIDDVYRDVVAASRTPEQRKALGQRLLRDAIATANDPAGKYALLLRARDTAADAGDVDTVLASVGEIERGYAVDAGSLDVDAVNRLSRLARGPEVHRQLTRYLLGSANEAVAADRFDVAKKAIDLAATLVAKASDTALARIITIRSKEIREVEAAFALAKPAMQAIEKGSADPAHSFAAGRYRALFKADFASGLPLLATGSDAVLKDLATKDLAGAGGAADQLLVLADGWYDVAEKNQGVPRNLAMLRAKYWYDQADAGLTGLAKAKAAKRSKDAEPLGAQYALRSGGAAVGTTTSPPANHGTTPSVPTPPRPNPDPTPVVAGPLPFKLPAKFNREWKSPESWVGKPEAVTITNGRVTITNENGANTVCENEQLLPQKDGSIAIFWDYGPEKAGYEQWFMKGGELVIHRWRSKADKDSGVPARRIGFVPTK